MTTNTIQIGKTWNSIANSGENAPTAGSTRLRGRAPGENVPTAGSARPGERMRQQLDRRAPGGEFPGENVPTAGLARPGERMRQQLDRQGLGGKCANSWIEEAPREIGTLTSYIGSSECLDNVIRIVVVVVVVVVVVGEHGFAPSVSTDSRDIGCWALAPSVFKIHVRHYRRPGSSWLDLVCPSDNPSQPMFSGLLYRDTGYRSTISMC